MLFAPSNPGSQTDNFCFQCHKGTGSVQVSFDRTNFNYSFRFGGDTFNHSVPNNIYDAFNPASGSSHNLQDILDFVKTKWPETFGDESNPCNACHNPHLSQRDYPIARPTDRSNVWGDEDGEKMFDFAAAHEGQYQAPYRYGSTEAYEPDGSGATNGSNLPDYVSFCSDCHNATNEIYSSTLGRYLRKVDWSRKDRRCYDYDNDTAYPPGDMHGSITRCWPVQGMVEATCGCVKDENGDCLLDENGDPIPASANWGGLKDPYFTADHENYILSCTDCHEPHGSGAVYLLRESINGIYVQVKTGPGPHPGWDNEYCQACHDWNWHCGGWTSCFTCHYHSAYNRCWACTYCVDPGAPVCVHGHSF
jgi:hypothetical protein